MSDQNRKIAVVVGGAVAGSEAVSLLNEQGFTVVCIEQNAMPYGKIEDGLPRWHVEQRRKEAQKIDEKLNRPNVHYLPLTKVGKNLDFSRILSWKPSAVLLANGAWKDRPLPVPEIENYVGKGFLYQNPLVYWFNHYEEPNYNGPTYEIPDGTIVIGGGLASLDVMKICQLQLVRNALKARGIFIDAVTLEKEGVDKALEAHQLKYEDLNLKGSFLYFRRKIEDMSLAEVDASATEEQKAKVGQLRAKILNNYRTKFRFNVVTERLPASIITEGGRLVGLTFLKTDQVGQEIKTLNDTEEKVHAPLVISSIGSIPEPIPSLPLKGERYEIDNWDIGSVKDLPGVFILGNALTGKGNIRVSMMHSRGVVKKLLETYLASPDTSLNPTTSANILAEVKQLQAQVGYHDYESWKETHSVLKDGAA